MKDQINAANPDKIKRPAMNNPAISPEVSLVSEDTISSSGLSVESAHSPNWHEVKGRPSGKKFERKLNFALQFVLFFSQVNRKSPDAEAIGSVKSITFPGPPQNLDFPVQMHFAPSQYH